MCLAVPGKILEISRTDDFFRSGRVSFGGIVKDVNLTCVPEARVNEFVLVHVGMALSVLDEHEAAEVLACLELLDEAGAAGPRRGDDPVALDVVPNRRPG